MSAPQNTIAVIFDFDDTLTDETTTKLLEAHGIDSAEFWLTKRKAMVDEGWNPTLGYLKLILDHVGPGKALGTLSNAALREFGASLEFYPGLPDLFDDLQTIAKEHRASNPTVEFYVISGGLEEIILGSKIAPYFTSIWGCRFAEEDGVISHIKSAVTFTEKTKYIFEINKGLNFGHPGPYAVNEFKNRDERRVPFKNMIYIGDGFTDVPCFSLVEGPDHNQGKAFGVFDPKKKDAAKVAWEKLAAPGRVRNLNPPEYGPTDALGSLLRAAFNTICVDMDLRLKTAS